MRWLILLLPYLAFAQKEEDYRNFSDTLFRLNDVILAPRIEFVQYQCDVLPEYFDSVNVIRDFLLAHKNFKVEIGVHDEDRGSAKANRQLCICRAKSIETYLRKQGIHPHALLAKGYGSSRPRYTRREIAREREVHKAPVTHSLNKRVEIKIIRLN